jgi:hypothetical protein
MKTDLRFASDQERRYALAYLRWRAGRNGSHQAEPRGTHYTYALTAERSLEIRQEIDSLIADAAGKEARP